MVDMSLIIFHKMCMRAAKALRDCAFAQALLCNCCSPMQYFGNCVFISLLNIICDKIVLTAGHRHCVVVSCACVTFPYGVPGQLWYLIV